MLDSKTGSPIAQIIIFDWNKQSTHIADRSVHTSETLTMFKNQLKTHLFAVAYTSRFLLRTI